MNRLLVTIAFALLIPATATAGGKKPPPMSVSFHMQADQNEGKKFVFPFPTAGKTIFYSRSAIFTEKDIVAFQSFPSDDPTSYGLILQLRKVAKDRLVHLSGASEGQFLLAMVNGTVRDAVLIDRSVTDGLLVIWQRIGAAEVRMADSLMPRIGEDHKVWKQRMKEQK